MTGEKIRNGDGLCFFKPSGELTGFRVNLERGRIFPNVMAGFKAGVELYRNHDHEFLRMLTKSSAVQRVGRFGFGSLTL